MEQSKSKQKRPSETLYKTQETLKSDSSTESLPFWILRLHLSAHFLNNIAIHVIDRNISH